MTQDPRRRILVLNEFGHDLGEQATFAGFVRALGDATDEAALEVTIDQSPLGTFPFRASTIATVNESYDLVVLAGGALIAPHPEGATASGWAFDIPEALIERLRVPFAIYGVGYDRPPFAKHGFDEETASHLGHTVAHAAHFSVRDPGSLEMMQRRFDIVSGVRMAPDPAVHVQPVDVEIPGLPATTPILALSLEVHALDEELPGSFGSLETFMNELLGALRARIARGDHVLYAPLRLERPDIEIGRLLTASLPAGSVTHLYEAIPALYRAASFDGPSVLAGALRRAGAVIAQPAAAIVAAASVGTPVLTLSANPSRRWLHEAHGLPPWLCLDLTRFRETVNQVRIATELERAAADREIIASALHDTHRALVRAGEVEIAHLVTETLVGRRHAAGAPRSNAGAGW